LILTFAYALLGAIFHFFYFKEKASDVLFVNSFHIYNLDSFFYIITQSAETIFLLAVIILLAVFYKRELWHIAVSQLLIILVVNIIKTLVASKRPVNFLLNHPEMHYLKDVYINKMYSFPSGHTAAAFTLACSLSLMFSKHKWLHVLLFFWAVSVGISRIYLVQHFLIDTAAGAVLGALISYWVFVFFQNYKVFRNGIRRIKK